MPIVLKSTQDIGLQSGVKILVYGKSGRGKTSLCATCPNPIILSAESGLLSLSKFRLPYIEIRSISDLREAYSWVKSSQEARQFQTVCLDSISEIGEVSLAAIKARLSGGKSGKGDMRQAYGEVIEEMAKIIKEFRDLDGYNIYMSAKEEFVKNELTGIISNQPSMPGSKLGQMLPYLFDEVFQLDIEGIEPGTYRFLRTQPDMMNEAKDRSGVLSKIEEPHLGKIIQKIIESQAA
jgi:AAA domain